MAANKFENNDSSLTINTPSKPSPIGQRIVEVDVIDISSLQVEGLDQGSDVNLSSRSQRSDGVNINHGESNIFTPPPSSAKKRKKKKAYWPKILDESKTNTKRTYKSMNTPKPSTPKQRKKYVRKRPSCMGPLFPQDSVSLAFMEKPSKVEEKVEEIGSNNSLFKNEFGIEYNSLQTYQKLRSLVGSCLIESRQIGVNFPRSGKKKRKVRERACLEKLLQPYNKGKRSKTFKRKKRCWNVLNPEGKIVVSRVMKSLIKKLKSLKKKREKKKETNKKTTNQVVVYKEHQIVPYKGPHSKYQGEVELDGETLRVWNLLLDGKAYIEHEKQKYWEEKRYMYQRKIGIFMTRMHNTLGDRRFLSWKGSVLDSVVGVFLTQNVSDYLSSGAFMNLAAKFPAKTTSYGSETTVDFDEEIEDNKVEVEDNKVPEFDKEIEGNKVEEVEDQNAKDSCEVDNKGAENNSSKVKIISDKKKLAEEEKDKVKKEKEVHWDMLRKMYTKSTRHSDHEDIVDWEAVRCAKLSEFAEIIKCRGQHNIIAAKIQRLLNHLKDTYGNLDLEWIRYAPPMDVNPNCGYVAFTLLMGKCGNNVIAEIPKTVILQLWKANKNTNFEQANGLYYREYLLSIYGLGLKSVECIRLLALQHSAFPVDVNVGRIVVRLGWVPLKPLPESMQIHDLEKFPKEEDVQRYLWPRICNLNRKTLYQLHYQMITFGKVFCGKGRPNCNACPMREEGCKYYESKLASKKLALPGPTSDKRPIDNKMLVTSMHHDNPMQWSTLPRNSTLTFISELNNSSFTEQQTSNECEPIIEMPASPLEPEIEGLDDIELNNDDEFYEGDVTEEIDLTINLSSQESRTHDYYSLEDCENEINMSRDLVTLPENVANTPLPKMKREKRTRTERWVYILPDDHPLLEKRTPRLADDRTPYLLVVYTKGELKGSCESTENNSQEEEDDNQTVPGTLLVFADYDSLKNPINVPRRWLWDLHRCFTYFGTAITTIVKGK
ncbi:hypothetical protein TanjilG_06860 [Lupinus angustifolius]|uniref:Uncharacterized protein n=1 Tax=Lupinus angustifolius TaxID=3871 RepID=A0A4P1RRQ2_LUPAN|nr:hypothetical protein TanjilG_06860 [Lupinus angustifolius]